MREASGRTTAARSLCPDRDALRELLFAYYYLGDVRNITNHAADEFSGFISIMDDSDISERMNMITQAVDYFLFCYERVTELIQKQGTGEAVVKIEPQELVAYADTLRKALRNERKRN